VRTWHHQEKSNAVPTLLQLLVLMMRPKPLSLKIRGSQNLKTRAMDICPTLTTGDFMPHLAQKTHLFLSIPSTQTTLNFVFLTAFLLGGCNTGNPKGYPGEEEGKCSPGALALQIDSQDANSLLLAYQNRIFTSTDLGSSWSPLSLDAIPQSRCLGVVGIVAESSAQGLICAEIKNNPPTCTNDNGRTWRQLTSPEVPIFGEIFVINPGISGRIFIRISTSPVEPSQSTQVPRPIPVVGWTDDFGTTWHLKRNDGLVYKLTLQVTKEGPYIIQSDKGLTSISKCNDELDCNVIYKSPAGYAEADVNPFNPNQMLVWPQKEKPFQEKNPHIFISSGGAEKKAILKCGMQCGYLDSGSDWGNFFKTDADDLLWSTNNGGDTWTLSGAFPLNNCSFSSSGSVLFCSGTESIYRSFDMGKSWKLLILPMVSP
jgi:hypothetical protein